MVKVLIACDNDSNTALHDFLESCADEVKQICADNCIEYSYVCPPNMSSHNVIGAMSSHQLCFFAGHGDIDGIYNEKAEPIVSIYTTNYNFKNKGFYSVACLCAQKLYPHLESHGLQFFVGYKDTFNVRGEREPFIKSAVAGLKTFLNGDALKSVKEKMIAVYDKEIAALHETDPMSAIELLHNKESLVFAGNADLLLTDLE